MANPKQPAPKVFEHKPGKTIAQAVSNAAAHVQSVHKVSKAK